MVSTRPTQQRPVHSACRTVLLLTLLAVLAVSSMSCSNAAKELRFKSPSPQPGVVYVAEQVGGLEEWARGPESRAYARIYTRAGEADEGQLVRITGSAVVLGDVAQPREISRDNVLFMRVWW